MADEYETDYFRGRLGSMKNERTSFDTHWKELAQFIRPRRGRFFITDTNRGDRRHQSIVHSRGTQAHKIATSGMHAGIMSPARPWFMLGTPDPDLMEFAPVSVWLFKVTHVLNEIFRQSNLYNMAPVMLGEEILFATGAMLHVDDFEDVARFYTATIGSYWLAQNHRLEIDTFAREFQMTPLQMARKWGENKLSATAKRLLDAKRGQGKDTWCPVTHFIEPSPDFNPRHPLGDRKAFRSVYFEPEAVGVDKEKFLDRGGFDDFPVYAPRWEVTGEDIYGTDCPAMTALGDIKGLQIKEKRKAQALDKSVSPPLKGPGNLRNVPISQLPGGATLYDGDDTQAKLEPIYMVRPDWKGLAEDMRATERLIDEAFHVDLFKPITQMEGIQPRNQLDLSQRQQEAMLQLGPVLERQHGDFLTKLIDRTFNQCVRANILPEAPEELRGKPLKVTYISTLAMAQKAVAAGGIDRLAGFVGGLVKAGLSDGKKFDGDQAIDEYGQIIGTPPRVIVPDDVVVARRQQEQKKAQMEQMAQMAQSGANTVKMLSDAKPDDSGDSVLKHLSDAAGRRARGR